jgi:hypothetical protein
MSAAAPLVGSAMAGAVAGLMAVAGLLFADRHGLIGLLARDPLGYIAIGLLALDFSGTFAAAAFGSAVGGGIANLLGGGDDADG